MSDTSLGELEQLYRARYRRFLRVALAITGSREAAADAVQEAFARAIRHRFDFRGEGSLESWVWRTVINAARTHRVRGMDVRTAEDAPAPAHTSNGHAERWPELRAAVASLPERQRLVIFLRHYADLSYVQIAETLEIERGTVAATLHAAHAALRKTIKEVPR